MAATSEEIYESTHTGEELDETVDKVNGEGAKANQVLTKLSNGETGWVDAQGLTSVAWDDVTGKPETFTPSAHTHTKSEITDFAHTHTKSEITDFAHTHTKSEITDFPDSLPANGGNADTVDYKHASDLFYSGRDFLQFSTKVAYNQWNRVAMVTTDNRGWGLSFIVNVCAYHASTAHHAIFLCSATYSGILNIKELSGPHRSAVSIRINSDSNYPGTVYIDLKSESSYTGTGQIYSVRITSLYTARIATSFEANVEAQAYSAKATSHPAGGFYNSGMSVMYVGDNAATATRLASDDTKTAWGQTFWSGGQPQAISSDMSSVGNISFSESGKNIGGIAYFDTTNNYLGIGTSSPSATLHVNGSTEVDGNINLNATSERLIYGGTSANWGMFINTTSMGWYDCANNATILKYTSSSTASLRYFSIMNCNVGIGTYRPSAKLHVAGNILATGGVTAYSTSDRRLKENIEDVDCLAEIETLGGVKQFDFKKDGKHSVGLIAQEVQKSAYKDAVFEREDKILAINYLDPRFISLALGGVEQLSKKCEHLEQENAELKSRLAKLESMVEQLINK